VLNWPLREALESFMQILRERAERNYRWEMLQYSVLAPHMKKDSGSKPPQIPDILKD